MFDLGVLWYVLTRADWVLDPWSVNCEGKTFEVVVLSGLPRGNYKSFDGYF